MFQFSGFPPHDYGFIMRYMESFHVGFPIRISAAQRICAPYRSFSQLVTSFFGSQCQGIHPALFLLDRLMSMHSVAWARLISWFSFLSVWKSFPLLLLDVFLSSFVISDKASSYRYSVFMVLNGKAFPSLPAFAVLPRIILSLSPALI